MKAFILESKEYVVVTALNRIEGMEKVSTDKPDLILLDLFMPRLDGYGVMKAAKSSPVTKDIPIVVLSAWPTGDNRERARKAGALDFIAKPYKPTELAQQIREYLSNLTDSESVLPKPDTAPLET